MTRPHQWQRVLAALREAGREGVTTSHIRYEMGIANPAERIQELEALGHQISSTPEKRPGGARIARYRLVKDAHPSKPLPLDRDRPLTLTDPTEDFRTELARLDAQVPSMYDPVSW